MVIRPLHVLVWGVSLAIGCGSSFKPDDAKPLVNTDPTVEITSPEDGDTYGQDRPVLFQALVGDDQTEAYDLGVIWSSSLNGDFDAGPPNAAGLVELTLSDLSMGEHLMTATVIDDVGERASDSISINIVEAGDPPTITLLYPTDGDFGMDGATIAFEAMANDPDDLLPELLVIFTADNETSTVDLCSTHPDETGFSTCTASLDEGVWEITGTVFDGLAQIGTDTHEDFPVYSVDEDDADGDGYTELDADCDDTDASIHPGATEQADGVDEDCDGLIDEGTDIYDDDGDGFSEDDGDCDDTDADLSPAADELCDGEDNDCDDLIDEEDPDTDVDEDGYSVCDDDCDDEDDLIHPGRSERCNDIDDDCDGLIDESASDADIWYRDSDGDGYGDPAVTEAECTEPTGAWVANNDDCDDSDDDIHPGATEVCDAADTDEDCDGIADGSDASGRTWWYRDSDGDGYGLSTSSTRACDRPSGYVSTSGDCDDGRSSAYPGATETCDDIDNDCDSTVDEEGASGCSWFYYDADSDGYGTWSSKCLCDAGDVSGYSADNNDDCCDSDWYAKPGSSHYDADETGCGGWDYNCDGIETKASSDIAGCSLHLSGDACYEDPAGWSESVPACGDSGDWVYDCNLSIGWGGLCAETTVIDEQTCG